MPPDAALPSPRLSDSNAPGYRIQEALICQFTFFSNAPGVDPFPPFAQMQDGTLVHARAGIGGMSEIMTAFEEYCVPVFTDLTAAELTLLGDQLASGFAAGHSRMVFEPGSDVAVFGAGPVGLGAIQAGRVMGGAGQVIAIDPIRYRRELALTPGATIALDPSVEGDGIVERVRELCRGQRSPVRGRHDVGTRRQRRHGTRGRLRRRGAGLQALPPKVEAKPDPANVKTVQQAWDCTGWAAR